MQMRRPRTVIALRRQTTADLSGNRAVRFALGNLALATLLLASLEAALFESEPVGPKWTLLLFLGVAVIYVLSGLLAWSRRPSNRIGALLYVGGVALLLAALQNTNLRTLVAVGLILGDVPIAVMLHILLAFPSGRLRSRLDRGLVLAGYFVTIVLQAPRYLFSDDTGPLSVLQVSDRHDLIQCGLWIQRGAGIAVILATAAVLTVRLRAATRMQRPVLVVLYSYGIAAILFLEAAINVLPPLFGLGRIAIFTLQITAAAGIPATFVGGLFAGGFARAGEIEELGAWLGTEQGGRPELRRALAVALGDPTVELLFWLPDISQYVDSRGAAAVSPASGTGRSAVEIELGGSRIGAIVYDGLLIAEPELVRAAGRVVALALERERLTAALLVSRDALSRSRARIIDAADRERRRIAQDLHDGMQAKLVLLALTAHRVASHPDASAISRELVEVRIGLEDASDELRRLVEGVMPALLIERGLFAATEDLVDRMPLPTRLELPDREAELPERVQRASYFVVAEALTNAVKHSRARELAVRMTLADDRLVIEVRDDGVGGANLGHGSGLRGIADRLDVLGGRLHIYSPRGQGTRLTGEVPCGL